MTRRLAFTAVEMVTVIAIIGILAVMAVPAFASSQKKSRLGEALDIVQRMHRQAQTACRQYLMTNSVVCPTATMKIENTSAGTVICYRLAGVPIDSVTLSPNLYLKSVIGASTSTTTFNNLGDVTFTYDAGSGTSIAGTGKISSIAATTFTAPTVTAPPRLRFSTVDGKFERSIVLYEFGFVYVEPDVTTN